MNKLRAWYGGLQQREQRVVLAGSVGLLLLLVAGGVLLPLQSAVSNAVKHADQQREDLTWMQTHAAEVSAGGASVAADSGEAPVVLVDRIGREAGLTDALRGTQPNGNGVRVQLEAASFDALISWLDTLDQRYGLAIESINVDRTAKPGLVNANITFTQSHP